MAAIVVLTTVPNRRTGFKLAKVLVQEKLAACVSVSAGIRSVYRWKGKIEAASEALLVIKTSRKSFSKLEQKLKRAHPYESPEIIALPVVAGTKKYLSWIQDSSR